MAKCKGKTKSGTPCQRYARVNDSYCCNAHIPIKNKSIPWYKKTFSVNNRWALVFFIINIFFAYYLYELTASKEQQEISWRRSIYRKEYLSSNSL